MLKHVSIGCEVSDIFNNDPASVCVRACVCVCVCVLSSYTKCTLSVFTFWCCHDFHYFVFMTASRLCLLINKSQYNK